MKKQLIPALSLFTLIVMGCEEINPGIDYSPESANAPAIYSTNPESAVCGTEISILGENFGTSLSDNFVTFDALGSQAFSGRISEVTQVHAGRLLVRIPMKLNPGEYTISLEVNGQATSVMLSM